ncbi:MAG: SDR family NAD(P)-dependent oxidoreductase [Myxococcota bacterium]
MEGTQRSFGERYGPWAVVAGGSDGIGAAFGEALVRRGLGVVLIARSGSKLAAQAERLAAIVAEPNTAGGPARAAARADRIRTLVADLTSPDIAAQVARATEALDVGLFVYNAGSGREMGSFLDHEVDNWIRQVDLACRGPLLLAHHFGRRLRARGQGGIVLMSSLASLVGSAYIATYAAAKAFDTILGEGLWAELGPAGVDVVACLAGATDTETFREDTGGSPEAMAPREVATGTLDFLGRGPIYVPGASNRASARAAWPVPRVAFIHAMSAINARNFALDFEPRPGVEFGDA